MKAGILDYGAGNLRSLANALCACGHEPVIVSAPGEIAGVTHLLLPGQGEFSDCVGRLEERGLALLLKEWIANGRPYFGICVGYQILFDGSEEAPGAAGLGIFRGTVRRLIAGAGKKIPHMGWNGVSPVSPDAGCWAGLGSEPYFYYVHSYVPEPLDASVIAARTTYGDETFAAAIQSGSVLACQFHPEKSQDAGLRLISNFLSIPTS
ncbi:MAG: imidazole glycerol phosphate synthase subunit HisH [Verrucomicrobiota bacterium]